MTDEASLDRDEPGILGTGEGLVDGDWGGADGSLQFERLVLGVEQSGCKGSEGGKAEEVDAITAGERVCLVGLRAEAVTVALDAEEASRPMKGDSALHMDAVAEPTGRGKVQQPGKRLDRLAEWGRGGRFEDAERVNTREQKVRASELTLVVEDGSFVSANGNGGVDEGSEVCLIGLVHHGGDFAVTQSEVEVDMAAVGVRGMDDALNLDPLAFDFSGKHGSHAHAGGRRWQLRGKCRAWAKSMTGAYSPGPLFRSSPPKVIAAG